MLSLISDLKDFNIPTILVVLGAISILLALGVKGGIELDRANRRSAGIVGTIFMLLGISLFAYQPPLADKNLVIPAQQATAQVEEATKPNPTLDTAKATVENELQRIDFNYTDDPQKHGWRIQRLDLIKLEFLPVGEYGAGLSIVSGSKSAAYLEHPIIGDAKNGTILEVIAKTDNTTSIYVRAVVVGQNVPDPPEVWLKLAPRKADTAGQVKEVQVGEREFFFAPENLNDGWQLLRVDVKKLVQDGWKSEGYQLSGLKHLRLRGNLSLASIVVMKE